jgi:uncharacterized protein YkwD
VKFTTILSTMETDSILVLNQRLGILETRATIQRASTGSPDPHFQEVFSRLSTLETDLAALRKTISAPSAKPPAPVATLQHSTTTATPSSARSSASRPTGTLESSPTDQPTPTATEKACLDLMNGFRNENGLEPLVFSRKLTEICIDHTMAMFRREIPAGHQNVDARYKQVSGTTKVAENVGFVIGHQNPLPDMLTNWKNSTGHRKNLVGDYNQVGVTIVHDDSAWFATTLFAKI